MGPLGWEPLGWELLVLQTPVFLVDLPYFGWRRSSTKLRAGRRALSNPCRGAAEGAGRWTRAEEAQDGAGAGREARCKFVMVFLTRRLKSQPRRRGEQGKVVEASDPAPQVGLSAGLGEASPASEAGKSGLHLGKKKKKTYFKRFLCLEPVGTW